MREGAVELAPLNDLVSEDCRRLVQENKRATASEELSAFPGMSDEEKLKRNYLEANLAGELPEI
jgi:hypothetical protein